MLGLPRNLIQKRLGKVSRALPHFIRVKHIDSVKRSSARVVNSWGQPWVSPSALESKIGKFSPTDYSISREDFEPSQQKIAQGDSRAPDRMTEMLADYQKQDFQYFTEVPLDETNGPLRIGMSGQARIFTGYVSLGYRVWWWFNQNFRS